MFQSPDQHSIRILLIEEESLVRAALFALVKSWGGFEVIAQAGTKDEALDQFHRLHPDVVLLSIPGMEYVHVISDIAGACGRARLLLLFDYWAEGLTADIMGFAGRVIAKTAQPNELRKAILDIYAELRTTNR
jgi:DNA-binding NarL/FixJ family response regulator